MWWSTVSPCGHFKELHWSSHITIIQRPILMSPEKQSQISRNDQHCSTFYSTIVFQHMQFLSKLIFQINNLKPLQVTSVDTAKKVEYQCTTTKMCIHKIKMRHQLHIHYPFFTKYRSCIGMLDTWAPSQIIVKSKRTHEWKKVHRNRTAL